MYLKVTPINSIIIILGKVNEYLCNRVLIIFSRISYSVFLTQFLVFFYQVGIKRIPETFSMSYAVSFCDMNFKRRKN